MLEFRNIRQFQSFRFLYFLDMLKMLHSMIYEPVYEEESILAHKICINTLNSLGIPGCYQLLPGIYELHRPPLDVEPKIDVVFVHGIRGTVFWTWRQRNIKDVKTTLFWPKVIF